ncbi:MAG: MBL fold metallo-hydrolase [Deltaproteobacteria bacterium]|nr:MBL fold metallo-hydrolase [Deltaproteobacteria bacterium]
MQTRWTRWLLRAAFAVAFTFLGLMLARTDTGIRARVAATKAGGAAIGAVAGSADVSMRNRVLLENPALIQAIRQGGAFGGQFSRQVAQNMFSRLPKAIEDAKAKTEIVEITDRTWLIRLPIVNVVLFETDAGLVLVDTGMGPAGPAILDAIREVSDAPLHTVIYTHGHVDHAYGTWALLEAGESPEIIAHENLPARFERYVRLRGSLARYMSQPAEQLPRTREDLVWPTRTFHDRLEIEIGGERFVLQHHRGETDDQLYVWLPGRGALASADYYQGFLPNAGNGKRVQRHPEEWAVALREMAALEPRILLPAHGEAIDEPAVIGENLTVLADTLQYIVDHTLAGLNAGKRKDEIHRSLELPERLANHPTMKVQYVTPQDISKMVTLRYTGWWDDIPSHWTPAPLELRAQTLVEVAGGMEPFVARARDALETDLRLASHLADWAFLADPQHSAAQQLVLDVYEQRILDPTSNTMEMLVYLDAMAAARQAQLNSSG